jgi:cytochrome c
MTQEAGQTLAMLRRTNDGPTVEEVTMPRSTHITPGVIALTALFVVHPHDVRCATLSEDGAAAGHRLAAAWCSECHAIEAAPTGKATAAPDFADIASRPSTTALSLKVFLRTSHPSMPNIIIAPDQADDLANYILSLKRN